MDITGIVAALITGVVTVLGVIISNSRTQAVMEERIDALRRDMSELKSQVKEDHDLRERMAVMETNIKAAWRRIDEHAEDINQLKEENHA